MKKKSTWNLRTVQCLKHLKWMQLYGVNKSKNQEMLTPTIRKAQSSWESWQRDHYHADTCPCLGIICYRQITFAAETSKTMQLWISTTKPCVTPPFQYSIVIWRWSQQSDWGSNQGQHLKLGWKVQGSSRNQRFHPYNRGRGDRGCRRGQRGRGRGGASRRGSFFGRGGQTQSQTNWKNR